MDGLQEALQMSSVPFIKLSGFNGSHSRHDLVFDGRQPWTNEQFAAFCQMNKRPGWVRRGHEIGGLVYVLKKGCGHQVGTDYSDGLFTLGDHAQFDTFLILDPGD